MRPGLLLVLRRDGGGGVEPARLVVDGDRDVAQLLRVLPAVVGAEEQLSTGRQGDANVGLRAAAVTTVRSRQSRARYCEASGRPLGSFTGSQANCAASGTGQVPNAC